MVRKVMMFNPRNQKIDSEIQDGHTKVLNVFNKFTVLKYV